LTWTLLLTSVGMNGVVHALAEYRQVPVWWLIVGVSAIPPATLGAVVHLAVLVGRPDAPGVRGAGPDDPGLEDTEAAGTDLGTELPTGIGRRRLAQQMDISEHQARKILAGRNGAAR
jgi:hypothetical protein